MRPAFGAQDGPGDSSLVPAMRDDRLRAVSAERRARRCGWLIKDALVPFPMLRCWVCFGIQAGPHTQTGLTRCEPAYICFRGAARRRWGPRSGEEFSHPYKDLGTEFSGVWFDADLHSYP